MHLKKLFSALLTLLLLSVIALSGCNKNFDEPPSSNVDPDIQTNASIADIKSIYSGSMTTIAEDKIFSGIVISSDEAGNIYKTIYLEDSTGGINIQVDASNTNAIYPLGRRVFVKAKGLTLGAYGGVLQLGLGTGTSSGSVGRIPQNLLSTYMIGGSIGHVVEPVEVDLSELNDSYLGMLVKIPNVEFSDVFQTYADTTTYLDADGTSNMNNTAVDLTMQNCNGNSIILRNSSYASFASDSVKRGNGSIVAIYSKYNSTQQLYIRDTSDLSGMTNLRCDGTTGEGSPIVVSTIAELRALYNGSNVSINGGTITAVVVSNSANEASNNYKLVSEDNSAGIVLYESGLSLSLGDKVTVNLKGATLTTYNGDLELTDPNAVTKVSSNASVTPKETTIADILANAYKMSTTLVTLKNVTITKGSTTSSGQNYTISDGTNSLSTYVRSASGLTFSEGTGSVTGYVSLYKSSSATDTTKQIGLRTTDDIVYTSTGGTGGGSSTATSLSEDFSSVTTGNDASNSGSGTAWDGNDNFPSPTSVYQAGGMIKLGTSSKTGSIVSKSLNLSGNGGQYTVTLDAKGWSAVGSITISSNHGASKTVNYTDFASFSNGGGGQMTTMSATFTDGTANTTITITTGTPTRAFVDNVKVQ